MSKANIIIKLSSLKDRERKLIGSLYPDLVADSSYRLGVVPKESDSFNTSQIRTFFFNFFIF